MKYVHLTRNLVGIKTEVLDKYKVRKITFEANKKRLSFYSAILW